MIIHPKTSEILNTPNVQFSDELIHTIDLLLDYIAQFSPLSDISFILKKKDKNLPGLKIAYGDWMPIRNILRLLGKIANLDLPSMITKIDIQSMRCGCDSFEGDISITTETGEITGRYRWQWTAFPGGEKNFDKFTDFPRIQNIEISN